MMISFLQKVYSLFNQLPCRPSVCDVTLCTPVYALPRPVVKDVSDAQSAIVTRHVQQLKQPKLASIISSQEHALKEMVELVGISLREASNEQTATNLEQWTTASSTQMDAAKQAYGSKSSPDEVDWNVARLGLMQSTLIYLRDFTEVKAAVTAGAKQAKKALAQSQQAIVSIAETWGLSFTVLCDLVDDHPVQHWLWDGPFCGAYYSASPSPFIVVAFKGTTPSNLGEWFVDIDVTAAAAAPDPLAGAAGPVLFGAEVSKGVTQALFSPYSLGEAASHLPFDLIVMGLQDLATALGGTVEKQVPVYVTGHSLGASYATLFYAESMRRFTSPLSPLQPFTLVDLHTFGAPRVGLSSFGLSLRALVALHARHTWRIVDENDIVPSVPPVDGLEQVFEHIDCGLLVQSGKAAEAVKSELGNGYPVGYLEGSVAAHSCESYYEAIVSASTTQ